MINLTQIKPNIFIGSYPQNDMDIERLQTTAQATAVLNLQTDDDFESLGINWGEMRQAYRSRGILCQRYPIIDFSPVDLENRLEGAVDALTDLLEAGNSVYVHCTAGVCRAPAVVMGYLSWIQNMGPKAAIRFVTKMRRCSPYTDSIYLVHVERTYKFDRTKVHKRM